MSKLVLILFLMVNVYGFFLMYRDKEKAKKGEYRIPEATLWRVTLLGGAIGTSLGMKQFRHKTQVNQFKYGLPAVAIVHVIIALYLVAF